MHSLKFAKNHRWLPNQIQTFNGILRSGNATPLGGCYNHAIVREGAFEKYAAVTQLFQHLLTTRSKGM